MIPIHFHSEQKLQGIQIASPSICANCGEQQGTQPWVITSTYGRVFLLVASGYQTLTFQVPVCEQCETKLNKLRTSWHIVFMVCGLGSLGVPLLSYMYPPATLVLCGLAILALLTAFLAYWKRSIYLSGSNIGSYDGKYFWFKNAEFQQQFAVLNPTLTQQYD